MDISHNDEVELTEEELMLKLHRINQEIREVKERTMKVYFATAVTLAKSVAIEMEIAAKKIRLAMVNVTIPEDIKPEVAERKPKEEVSDTTPFLGRLKEGDKKITLQAYCQNHSVEAELVSCALIYETFEALGILNPLEGLTSQVEPEDAHKTCAYHKDQRGHTSDECVELRTAIHDLISIEKISYMWGAHTILTCDQLEPGIPVTEVNIGPKAQ
uniref:Uncharacterized protein n=1 Tax=Solanum tuberosum TaxID=4113 RepID=M1DH40_SOLTU